jgi:endonuclease G
MSIVTRIVLLAALVAVCSATVGFSNCSHLFVDGYSQLHQPEDAVQVCREGALAISYDVLMVNPAWAAYYVTPMDAKNAISGRLSFYEDPDLKAMNIQQASDRSDAFNTSWNRGHLAPSHAMSGTYTSKKSCYTMANISPQSGRFNQQPWNHLESRVFEWIKQNSSLHIITGVMYDNRDEPDRTYDDIAVPNYYFKILCDKQAKQSVGFVGENRERTEEQREDMWLMRPVKEVEDMFGGELFPHDACNTDDVYEGHWWPSDKR